jgi:hypothetical protein
MSDQVADHIDDAVDLMEKEGRTRGLAYVPGQGYCSTAALLKVKGLDPRAVFSPVSYHMPERRAIEARLPDMGMSPPALWCFNDRTADDQVVFDLMRRTAKELRIAEDANPETPAPPGTPDPRGVGQELPGDAPMSG